MSANHNDDSVLKALGPGVAGRHIILLLLTTLLLWSTSLRANFEPDQQSAAPLSGSRDDTDIRIEFSGRVFMCRGTDCTSADSGVDNVLVALFRPGDNVPSQVVTTAEGGYYRFLVCKEDCDPADFENFRIAVDASTFTQRHTTDPKPDYDKDDNDLYPEQTWNGSGGVCNGVHYSNAGYCYGGKNNSSDNHLTNTRDRLRTHPPGYVCDNGVIPRDWKSCLNAANAEHLIRTIKGSTSNLDFGFSYDVVTHTDYKGQGSLLNFVHAANAGLGTGQMLFVPTVPANNGSNAWLIKQMGESHILPEITADGITIDGRAMQPFAPDTPVSLATPVTPAVTVGDQEIPLAAFTTKDLELRNTLPKQSFFKLNGPNQTISNMSFTSSLNTEVEVINVNTECVACTIKDNLIGVTAKGNNSSFTTPTAIESAAGSELTIDHNLIGKTRDHVFELDGSVVLSNNYTRKSADSLGGNYSVIFLRGGLANRSIAINHNLLDGARGYLIFTKTPSLARSLQIANNTLTNGGKGHSDGLGGGIKLQSDSDSYGKVKISGNRFEGNIGPGVLITGQTSHGNLISKNRFNDKVAIDLGEDGIDANTGNYEDNRPNRGIDRPILESYTLDTSSREIIVTGHVQAESTVEFYQVNGNEYRFLFEATEGSEDDLDGNRSVFNDPVSKHPIEQNRFEFTQPLAGFGPPERLVAIAIDADGNTSEFSPAIGRSATISGFLWHDLNLNGIREGNEPPLANINVQLTWPTSRGTTVKSTDKNGYVYFRSLTPGSYQVSVLPGQSALNGLIPGANMDNPQTVSISDLITHDALFGFVRARVVSLTPVHNKATAPGLFVHFDHTLAGESNEPLMVATKWLTDNGQEDSDSTANWPVQLRSFTCGTDGSESTLLEQPVTLDRFNPICLRAVFFVPGETALNTRRKLEISVNRLAETRQPEAQAAIQPGEQITRVVNRLTVGDQDSGRLVLTKTVANKTLDEASGTSNTAGSGDILIYTIHFENMGSGPLRDLNIMDHTPAFTRLSEPVTCPVGNHLPMGLGRCGLTTLGGNNEPGFRGRIIWSFDGSLAPGAQGEVSYELLVE